MADVPGSSAPQPNDRGGGGGGGSGVAASTVLSLSAEDRARVSAVARHAARGAAGISALVALLDDPSWAVRRAVVTALAEAGESALAPLCEILSARRDHEARLAAAVDALSASEGDADAAVLPLIASETPAVVCDAAQVLGRRRRPQSVVALAGLIEHPDDNVAVAAIEALGRIGGGAAVDALIAAARSGNFFRTFPAIDVLGRTGDPRVVAPLAALLDEPLYAVEAARALGRTGDVRAVAPLVAALGRGGSNALSRAVALALLDVHDAQRARGELAIDVPAALRHAPSADAATRRVVHALGEADASEQVALARAIGWLGRPAGLASLLALLDADAAAARAAANALGDLGPEADVGLGEALRAGSSARRAALLPLMGRRSVAVPDVLGCLSDADPVVRAAACDALARSGDTQVVGALFERLADHDPRVVQAATGAIQALGGAQTEQRALEAARSPDTAVRRAALRIIAYFGYPRGADVLLEALGDPDPRVRDAAVYGLPTIESPRAVAALLAAAEHPADKTRAAAMRALGQANDDARVRAALTAGLRDPDAWVRYFACQSLGRRRAVEAVKDIVARVDDAAGQVRVAAIEALAQLGTDAAVEALRRAAGSPDPDAQRAALIGLGIARRREALPEVLLAAAASADPATRLVALSAAAEFDGDEVLAALAAAASDDDARVRTAALEFLGARPGAASTQLLVGLLGDRRVRELVVNALARPVEGRVEALLAALAHADDDVAGPLVQALARVQRPGSVSALVDALRGASPAGRRAAAVALSAASTPEGHVALARAAAEDPDPSVRRICVQVLGR